MTAQPFERLRGLYARHGVWGALGLIPHNARLALRALSPRRRRAQREEREFDRAHGLDTATPLPVAGLGLDAADAAHAVEYKPSGIRFVQRILRELEIRHANYSFVDLGCGKGRALLLASHFPYHRIVGVELSPRLAAIAEANVSAYRPADQRCHAITIHRGDAAGFALPNGPLVIYLYNSFDDVVLARVGATIARTLAQAPRDLILLYVNPVHRRVLDALPALRIVADRPGLAIYRAADAGVRSA